MLDVTPSSSEASTDSSPSHASHYESSPHNSPPTSLPASAPESVVSSRAGSPTPDSSRSSSAGTSPQRIPYACPTNDRIHPVYYPYCAMPRGFHYWPHHSPPPPFPSFAPESAVSSRARSRTLDSSRSSSAATSPQRTPYTCPTNDRIHPVYYPYCTYPRGLPYRPHNLPPTSYPSFAHVAAVPSRAGSRTHDSLPSSSASTSRQRNPFSCPANDGVHPVYYPHCSFYFLVPVQRYPPPPPSSQTPEVSVKGFLATPPLSVTSTLSSLSPLSLSPPKSPERESAKETSRSPSASLSPFLSSFPSKPIRASTSLPLLSFRIPPPRPSTSSRSQSMIPQPPYKSLKKSVSEPNLRDQS